MELRKLTWDDFQDELDRNFLKKTFTEFTGTIIDVLKNKKSPPLVRIMAATAKGILDEKILQLFTCDCARHNQMFYSNFITRNAIDVSERFVNGYATKEEHEQACNKIEFDLVRNILLKFDAHAVFYQSARWAALHIDFEFGFSKKIDFYVREDLKEYAYNAELERQVQTLIYLIEKSVGNNL